MEWKYIIPFCIFSILISFVNPNSYHTLVEFIRFLGSGIRSEGFEEQPPFMMVSHLSINWLVYIILLVASVFTIIARFKIRAEHTVALIGTAFLSLIAMRYAVYFVMIATSLVPVILSNVFDRVVHKKHQHIVTLAGILLIMTMTYNLPSLNAQIREGYDRSVFPDRAVQFIQDNNMSGKMLNDVTWGGYIAFRLHPEQKVFVDTRRLNPEIYNQYLFFINANRSLISGVPMWKAVLDTYGISYIIHSPFNPYTGTVFPFVDNLQKDSEWILIYRDHIAVIFAREGTVPGKTQSGLQTGTN